MAPSEKSITDAIRLAVQRVWNSPGRDELTVNQIRSEVEAKLDLDIGFLKEGPWKQKSKEVVLDEHAKLLKTSQEPTSSQPTPAKSKVSPVKKNKAEPSRDSETKTLKKSKTQPTKKGTKRSSEGDKVQPRKRQKKQDTPVSDDEESTLTSLEDTPNESESEDEYVSDAPKPKKVNKAATKPAPKLQARQKVSAKDWKDEDEKSDVQDVDTPGHGNTKKTTKDEVESDSDLSVLLDEAPKPKSKTKSTSKGLPKSNAKSSKPSKAAAPSSSLTPDEELLKTLQSQLVKCGVRKIWGVILKEYGSDTKAKIRHLKGMLKDVGMEGRFSEARAKEIKEARELMADLEAVKEGDAKWGMGRESRSKKANERKKVVESDSDEEARSGNTDEKPPPRVARAKMDLAFLGDEESDSDD